MIRSTDQLRAVVCAVVLAVVCWLAPGQGVAELAGSLPGEFTDVGPDHWAYGEILACRAAGIVAGYADGTYHPEFSVSRAQMAVYISRGLAGDDASIPPGPTTASFPDVPTGDWAYKYVEYAKAQHIVAGYEDGTYDPDRAVNRGQMAVFVARAMVDPTGDEGLASYTPPGTPTFPDVDPDHWAYKYVEYCQAEGIVGGYADETYRPDVVVTRGQMAVYVQRAFELPIPAGPPAPDFTLVTLDGTEEYRLSDLKGRPVAILFWTSWCGYCGPQASDLETLYEIYQVQGFLVLGVGLDDPAALQAKADLLGLTFPVGYNPAAADLYDVYYIPHTYIIDRDGSITASFVGLQSFSTMTAAVQEVL